MSSGEERADSPSFWLILTILLEKTRRQFLQQILSSKLDLNSQFSPNLLWCGDQERIASLHLNKNSTPHWLSLLIGWTSKDVKRVYESVLKPTLLLPPRVQSNLRPNPCNKKTDAGWPSNKILKHRCTNEGNITVHMNKAWYLSLQKCVGHNPTHFIITKKSNQSDTQAKMATPDDSVRNHLFCVCLKFFSIPHTCSYPKIYAKVNTFIRELLLPKCNCLCPRSSFSVSEVST